MHPTPQLTNAEYVESAGTVCPYCKSEHITGGSVDIDGGIASQNVACYECDAEWTDHYRLVGYAAR